MNVEVVRSDRRKKTVQARMVGNVLRIAIPGSMTKTEEAHWVEVFRQKMIRRNTAAGVDLIERAGSLARRFGLSQPSEIVWSDRQQTLWGSCTPAKRTIRISNQVAAFPRWVLDYVIVHELAHLEVPDHSPDFWQLVNRYELSERARGFLLAKGAVPD